MKIAYICSEYPAISHTFVLREVEALRRLGASITTFTIRRTPRERLLSGADREAAESTIAILPPRWRLLLAHIKLIFRAPLVYWSVLRFAFSLARPGLRGRIWQLFYFTEAVFIWHECRAREIVHIHAHLANAATDVAMLAVRIGSAVTPRQPWSWSFTMHGPTEFFDLRHYRLAEKAQNAHFVVCISDFARSQLMALCNPDRWSRLRVIHVGIPVADFTRLAPYEDSGTEAEILYIGRLVPEKGQAVLLEAVASLTKHGRRVRVTLAGAGVLRSDLERLAKRLNIASQVNFLGAVGQDRLRDLYERASVFCLPSFGEGVPVVLMEAMAMEVPVISTRIAGIPELIESGRDGILVPPGRADALAAALESLLADPALRRRLGAQGREKVLREFDTGASAERLYGLFTEQLLGVAADGAFEPQAAVSKAGV